MAIDNRPQLVGKFLVWGEDEVSIYSHEGTKYPVTDCCQATAKGTEWGTCCRSCYAEVDSFYGAFWTDEEWVEDIACGRIVERTSK
jgi:hypothetical protein